MTAAETTSPAATARRTDVTTLTVAAWAALGAGAIHAAAIGVHAEARQAALVFTAVAMFQLGWGAVALAVPNRQIAIVGALGGAAMVGGWVLSQASGIGFVDGLERAESPQAADTFAALLAGVAALLCGASMTRDGAPRRRPVGRATGLVGIVAVVGMTVPGLVGASDHVHDHGDQADAVAAGHEHGDGSRPAGADDELQADPGPDETTGTDDDHADRQQTAAPKPYDPALPIDLGGVDGVTPQQQAAAENLIAITLVRLPQFADPAVAEAAGFHSIGDGFTGHEHYINWDHVDDDRVLDPDRPESLVYEMREGQKTLVAAMYMLGRDASLDDVPDLGGALTQWHVHDDLCFTDDSVAPQVRGVTTPGGECAPPLVKGVQVPMIHVWIVPHRCGPFAALDGVGGGQIAEGETRLCDHAHGG